MSETVRYCLNALVVSTVPHLSPPSSHSCFLARMLEDQQLRAGLLTRTELVGMESQLQEAAREKVCVCGECMYICVCMHGGVCMCVGGIHVSVHMCMCMYMYKLCYVCSLLSCICTGQAEVMTELEKRSAEVAMEKMEKDNLKRKIMEMEENLVG